MPALPTADQITTLQIDRVDRWHRDEIDCESTSDDLLRLICQQHASNFRLWHQEDLARAPAATDTEIAKVKRTIDRLNQQRNDQIELVDDAIAVVLRDAGVTLRSDAKLNTETAGSAIDRLSIMALRLFHYREQIDRDAGTSHTQTVQQRLAMCNQQHADLSDALQELLDDLVAGRKQHRTYRQMKMYNDPSLNPAIYIASKKT